MTQSNPTAVFDLPATLDQDAARILLAELRKLPRGSEVCLNAAAVSTISPGYLQILVSALKTFPNIGLLNASAAFAAGVAEYGVEFPTATAADASAVTGPATVAGSPTETITGSALEAPPAPAMPESAAVSVKQDGEPQSAGAAAAKKILTIDDSRTMRDMLRMTLSGAGYTVIQAIDGQDGLNALAQQPVDLIITDINMPKLDGFGVIRAVRSDPSHDGTPILVLSTESEQESKDIAKEAGATGWIVKPFDPEGLVKLVHTVCG